MAEMYELILNMPLLQGVGHAQISAFLAKAHLDFRTYNAGEVVCESGTRDDSVQFLISGTVRVSWKNRDASLRIHFSVEAPDVLDISHLFGMRRETPYSIKAFERCSLMRVSKKQYMELLQTHTIYGLNVLNLLCRRVQTPMELMEKVTGNSPLARLQLWVGTLTPSGATDIVLACAPKALAPIAGLPEEELEGCLRELAAMGLARREGEEIIIPRRNEFLESNIMR